MCGAIALFFPHPQNNLLYRPTSKSAVNHIYKNGFSHYFVFSGSTLIDESSHDARPWKYGAAHLIYASNAETKYID